MWTAVEWASLQEETERPCRTIVWYRAYGQDGSVVLSLLYVFCCTSPIPGAPKVAASDERERKPGICRIAVRLSCHRRGSGCGMDAGTQVTRDVLRLC